MTVRIAFIMILILHHFEAALEKETVFSGPGFVELGAQINYKGRTCRVLNTDT